MVFHSSNTQQQHGHPLGDAVARLLARRSKEELSIYHWICAGCGTVYADILPEECKSCGATALEFEYSATQLSH